MSGDDEHLIPVISPALNTQSGSHHAPDTKAYVVQPIPINSMNALRDADAAASTGCGIGEEGEAMYTLTKGHSHAVAQPIPFDTTQITSSANVSNPKAGDPCHPLAAGAHAPAIAFPANLSGTQYARAEDIAPSMGAKNPTAVACATGDRTHALTTRSAAEEDGTGRGNPIINVAMQVRRLTPVECERLQGFPDNYTNIPWRKKDEAPDGPRYKALGNSMAVPCMAWIGQRIAEVDRGD
jgi:DNA (cytosine-5)-methyltransferase 1